MNKKKLFTILSIALAGLAIVFTTFVYIRQSRMSALSLEFVKIKDSDSLLTQKLIAKNSKARKGIIKENGFARFAFLQNKSSFF